MIYSDDMILKDALLKYFSDNGLPADGGLQDKWARYKILNYTFLAFPNFDSRRAALVRHDVHHIVMDLDTSSLGEGLIAAWELATGCGRFWISWCMEPQALWFGILLSPRKTFQTFVRARRDSNFFHVGFEQERLLNASVGDIRRLILADRADSLKPALMDYFRFLACTALGVLMIVLFTPIFMFFTVLGFFLRV